MSTETARPAGTRAAQQRREGSTPLISGSGLLLARNWIFFSLYFLRQDLSRQFDRSAIGYGWLLIHQSVTILGIAFVYSTIFRTEISGFFPYLSVSILTWTMLSGAINEAPRVYHSAGPTLQSFRIPYATFALKMVLRHLVLFFYGLPIHALVLIYFAKNPFPAALLLLLHMPVLFVFLYACADVLGIVGARFRDFAPALGSLLYMIFLVSPIIYQPSSLPAHAHFILVFNPFYYLLEFIRRPLLGEVPGWDVYGAMLAFTVVAWILATWMNRRYSRYLVFWV